MSAQANVTAQSLDQQIEEHFDDQLWRLNNLYWIVNEKGEKVKFQMTAVQFDLFMELWYSTIILKSRQHGITTEVCIIFLDTSLFNDNIRCAIIAHNREDAESFFQDKIKFAYDNLEPDVKEWRKADTSSTRELKFNNNSAIRVGTSMRSSTNQYLHISEFGKTCRKYPEKAKEIKTGALNTVHVGQVIIIESTAEGKGGDFFEFCETAKKARLSNTPLTPLDMKFFFYGWFEDPRNQLDAENVPIPDKLQEYFTSLENLKEHWRGNQVIRGGINLTQRQKAWYAKKWVIQGDEMKREHPSTPEEAFETTIVGAYFTHQFQAIYREGRIKAVPHVPGIPVDTYWDIGIDDTTDIWFVQPRGGVFAVIDFLEHNGEGLDYYARELRRREQDRGYEYGRFMFPHDVKVREWGPGKTRVQQAARYGIKATPAPVVIKEDQIAATREVLPLCIFDEEKCAEGIKSLENYRKEWDEHNGCYRNQPLHDWASNAADAFHVFSTSVNLYGAQGLEGFQPKRK